MPKFNRELHLDDKIIVNGQAYDIRKLYAQAERLKQNINLRTGTVKSNPTRPRVKYDLEERIWQARAGFKDIMARYNLTESQARGIQWQARNIMDRLGIDQEKK